MPLFASSDSCKEIKDLLTDAAGEKVRLDNFDSGEIKSSFLFTRLVRTNENTYSITTKLIYPELSSDTTQSKTTDVQYLFDGNDKMCLVKIILENDDEEDGDLHVAVRHGRTIVIGDGIDGSEEEISIITVNPL